ncbi:hypothetical protein [Maribacter sp. 2307ULW6-5]|uniref:hypothetical protein n=1 Tax=Maribacter sp. 2307ULW6-5 TaxID=3386275 RepID=UPI0039BCC614
MGPLLQHNFFLLCYALTFLLSLRYYRKYFDTPLKYLPLILAYTLFNELLGSFIRYSPDFVLLEGKQFANDILYNVYDLFHYGFFYVLFWRLSKNGTAKKWLFFCSLAVLASYIISCFYQDPFLISLYWSTSLASLTLAGMAVHYFYERRIIFTWSRDRHNLMFWVAFFLLLFHAPFAVLFPTGYLFPELWETYHLRLVLRLLIALTQGVLCVGFVVSGKRYFR